MVVEAVCLPPCPFVGIAVAALTVGPRVSSDEGAGREFVIGGGSVGDGVDVVDDNVSAGDSVDAVDRPSCARRSSSNSSSQSGCSHRSL